MYTPKHFQNTDSREILDFIRSHGFGILVTSNGKILASHIPLELDKDGKHLTGHISAANPQAKDFGSEKDVLCIFQGPHAYISSSWYDHENVPTWNYIAVHVYGKISIISGEETVASLKKLVDKYESRSENPVTVERMSVEYLQKAVRGIVAFRIDIKKVEASYKLSQNRDKLNHTNVINMLRKRGEVDDVAIANEMEKHPGKI